PGSAGGARGRRRRGRGRPRGGRRRGGCRSPAPRGWRGGRWCGWTPGRGEGEGEDGGGGKEGGGGEITSSPSPSEGRGSGGGVLPGSRWFGAHPSPILPATQGREKASTLRHPPRVAHGERMRGLHPRGGCEDGGGARHAPR